MVTIYVMINDFLNNNSINGDFNIAVNEIQAEFNYVKFYVIIPDELEHLYIDLSDEDKSKLPETIHIKNKTDILTLLEEVTKDNVLISGDSELVQSWEDLNGKSIFYTKRNAHWSKRTNLVIFKNCEDENIKESIIKYTHLY